MKRLHAVLVAAATCFTMTTQESVAQSDLNIFGYFQTLFSQSMPSDSVSKRSNSFSTQQLNIFLQKDLNEDFSAFINLELTNSFSSERNWGALNLEDAWLRYSHSDAFNIKAGLLIPHFNALNEIKNRTPILPYVVRPLVYEASFSDVIDLESYVPQRAFLQVYGNLSVSDAAKFEYAVFAGNSDKEHIASAMGASAPRGSDTTTYKLIGGRLGFSYSDLQLGVSSTYDRRNLTSFGLGEKPRVRVGADLTYSIAGFTLDGEMIMVNTKLTESDEATLKFISSVNPQVGTSADQLFYYAYLTYNFSPQFYVFGGYSYMDNQLIRFFKNGFRQVTGGLGYRPIDQVVLKAQFANYEAPDNGLIDYSVNYLYLGGSVFF